ncbi:MAG: hypothetical protein HPY90_07655 [Syntrophothermus sp.]|uniref:hypothetical protein n=1 Tax=Syntrophothermus sp. TaxID=2736299 RepID=UPI00257FF49B|nr:hypothetical protein [Syntrophothermus sp.]NSW83136.1 hypothetical protein [Syntrophothermus sp.]
MAELRLKDAQADCDEKLRSFIERYCEGRQYDSCVNNSCPFSSAFGCRHPEHPKNQGGR